MSKNKSNNPVFIMENSRKINKKLREIENLKQKHIRSKEEDEKIEAEPHYRRMLDPAYKTKEEILEEEKIAERKQTEAHERKRRQYDRHLEKEKKRQEKVKLEREKKEKEEKEKEEKEKVKLEREKKEKEEKEKARQRENRSYFENTNSDQENQKRQRQNRSYFDNANQDREKSLRQMSELELEYRTLLQLHDNKNDKTFRVLSKKYHPDKNFENKSWAEEKQKQLEQIRENIRNENEPYQP
jgi:hypothetical protein